LTKHDPSACLVVFNSKVTGRNSLKLLPEGRLDATIIVNLSKI